MSRWAKEFVAKETHAYMPADIVLRREDMYFVLLQGDFNDPWVTMANELLGQINWSIITLDQEDEIWLIRESKQLRETYDDSGSGRTCEHIAGHLPNIESAFHADESNGTRILVSKDGQSRRLPLAVTQVATENLLVRTICSLQEQGVRLQQLMLSLQERCCNSQAHAYPTREIFITEAICQWRTASWEVYLGFILVRLLW